jgi:hypothetical protein
MASASNVASNASVLAPPQVRTPIRFIRFMFLASSLTIAERGGPRARDDDDA